MSPAEVTHRLRHLHVEGDEVVARFTEKSPEAVAALREVKPAILILHQAAQQAGCTEPLLTLVREFRMDLKHITDGMYTQAALVDAIITIGAVEEWQFATRKTA